MAAGEVKKKERSNVASSDPPIPPAGGGGRRKKTRSCNPRGISHLEKFRKEIDGRATPGVELVAQFDSTRKNLPGRDIVTIDRLRAPS